MCEILNECGSVCGFRRRGFITVPLLSLHSPLQHTSQRLLIIHWVLPVLPSPARCCRNLLWTPPTQQHPCCLWTPDGGCAGWLSVWWIFATRDFHPICCHPWLIESSCRSSCVMRLPNYDCGLHKKTVYLWFSRWIVWRIGQILDF